MEKNIVSKNPTISVVMAAYNASRSVGVTLQNILGQTYKNLEVIVVDDGSTDETARVVKAFQKTYDNIKLVTMKKNSGPFRARIVGADHATGSYLHFIDADDYLSLDFYRTTLTRALYTKADIVIGSIVLDFKNYGYIRDYPLINDLPFDTLAGRDVFGAFMDQGGLNFIFHMNSTKLYRMDLWHKARPHYDAVKNHLIMADDVAMNVPLWFFSERIERTPTATLFYVKDDNDSATSNYQISYKKMTKNIDDLKTVFGFFEHFLKANDEYSTYKTQLSQWRRAFVRVYNPNIHRAPFTAEEKSGLLKELHSIAPYKTDETWLDTPFFHINTPWKDGLELIKKDISDHNTNTVLFSFDSLVLSTPDRNLVPSYTIRQTGLELLELARSLNKTVRIVIESPDQKKIIDTLLTGKHSLATAEVANFGPGLVKVSLPRPLDIFLERGLDQPFLYSYHTSRPGTMLTILSIVANHFFDNPYVDFIDTTAFSGRLSFLGFYSLGLDRAIASANEKDTKAAGNRLLRLLTSTPSNSDDPYEAYFIAGIWLGVERFTEKITQVFGNDFSPLLSLKRNSNAVIDLAFFTPVWADRQLFRPLLYRYPDLIDPSKDNPAAATQPISHLQLFLADRSPIAKAISYLLLDHGKFISATKSRLNSSTARMPYINRLLRNSYRQVRALKRGVMK